MKIRDIIMKKILLYLLFTLTVQCYAYDIKSGFHYELGLGLQSGSVEGYTIQDSITGVGLSPNISVSYLYKFADTFYLGPMFRINLVSKNTIQGENIFTRESIDILTLYTPYSLMLRVGGLTLNDHGFEFVFGAESTFYNVAKSYAQSMAPAVNKINPSSNFVYGVRLLGFSGSTPLIKKANYGYELIGQTNTILPFKNNSNTWDVRVVTLSFFYLF